MTTKIRCPAVAGLSSVYENDKGSLVLSVNCTVTMPDGSTEGKLAFVTLATVANGINTKNVERCRACFPKWNGTDPFALEGNTCEGEPLEVELEEVTRGDPPETYLNIAWINPPGGGQGGASLPKSGDRAAITARWGAQFRAIAGGTKAGAATTPPPKPKAPTAPPTAPKAPPKPMPRVAQTRTLDECWATWTEQHQGKPENVVTAEWFDMIRRLCPNSDPQTLTPEDVAAIALELFPF